ncbi:MAG: hydroxyacid dehydrogenase [Acidobacteriota bacterium]|nr:hydroxyacid dehydrogenase [Acidobacteriota bacterium]MDE3107593.1 hydroxyacid dehydrogenase [Acidobacteriota bacterium]MDE3223534.1 hydroxyacid dehydrogenase [Acidobacteriota bacterium]
MVSVPTRRLANALGDLDDVTVIVWDLLSDPPRDRIDLVVPSYLDGPAPLARLAGVRTQLVQSQSIGYDQVATYLPTGHVFANAASVHEASTAELAVAMMLAAQRGLADFVRASDEGRWAPAWRPSLADRAVVLVGYGGVGAAIEARLAPFEVTVERVARTARHDERGVVHGVDELPTLLVRADVVVVAVPLTEETTHLVNEAFLAAMPDGALLVNVARGRVADTDAILRHARARRLRFALDVTDPEPLPPGHELFSLPNVLITPHVGGATNAMAPRMVALLREQIERLRRGDEPKNVVLRT